MPLIGFHSEEGFVSLRLGYRSGHWAFCRCTHPNTEAQYHPFLDEVGVALQELTSAESIVLLGDFNAHVNTDCKTWNGVIGRQGDRNGRCLLQFCAIIRLCIVNTYFGTRGFPSTPGKEIRWDSILSLISILSQWTCFLLWSIFLLKEELNCLPTITLVVCILKGLNHPRTGKQFRAQRA